jgi:hypothetical protein
MQRKVFLPVEEHASQLHNAALVAVEERAGDSIKGSGFVSAKESKCKCGV